MFKKRGRRIKFMNLIYFLIFILLINVVKAECVAPQDGMFVNQDMVFCKGTYYLNKEMNIIRDNINIDCRNTTITGDKTNIGFLIENSVNTTIKNCFLNNFLSGIQASKSTNLNLTNNIFQNNSVGIRLNNVNNAITDNIFINNIENISITHKCIKDNFCLDNCNGSDADCKNLAKPVANNTIKAYEENISNKDSVVKKSTIRNVVSRNILEKIPIRKLDYQYASQGINLIKAKEIKGNKTIFEIKLNAIKDIKGLVIYEYFPKEALEDANLISSQHDFKIIEQDPLIMFEIKKELKADSVQVITYEVNKIIEDKNPVSIITIEAKGEYIKWLLAISIILYSIFIYINRKLKSKYRGLVDFIKSYSGRYAVAKNRLIRMGWPEYQIDEAISLVKEDKLSNAFREVIKFLKSFSAEIILIPYVYVFGLPDLNMRILPSEIITVIFFSIVNGVLLLLIIHKGFALHKIKRTY